MKDVKFLTILLLSVLVQSIAYSQPIISDSTCLNGPEMNFFIDQVYLAKEYSTSIVLKDKTISILKDESTFLRNESAEKDKEINLRLLQNKHCQDDKLYVEKQLNKALRGRRLFKTGFIIVGAVAVTELVYIGVLRVVR
jgi:hypothetical protein